MNRQPVDSSNVASVGYEPASLVLEVEFRNGSVYQYFDVPDAVYRELMSADSVGGFLNAHIRDHYRYVRI